MSGDELPPSLARWFAAAVPFVDGRSDVATLERALGRVARPDRLALMPEFIRWQALHAMRTLFARLRSAWDVLDPGAFDRAVAQHLRGARAKSGRPWSIGEGFPDALEANDDAPPWAAEMADLAWVTQILHTTDVTFDASACTIDPRLFVRFYAFEPGTTTPRPSAWLLFRDEATCAVVRERATVHDVMLVAELRGESSEHALAPDDRTRALEKLRGLGLVPTGPLDQARPLRA